MATHNGGKNPFARGDVTGSLIGGIVRALTVDRESKGGERA